MNNRKLTVLSSTGNLGDTPFEERTFFEGIKRHIDFLVADAGTKDFGPTYLGSDTAHNPIEWEKHDLELLLLASRERNIPLIIGSCGSTGTNRGVVLYETIIEEVAKEHRLPKFKLAKIYSELDKKYLIEKIKKEPIEPLGAKKKISIEDINATRHVTAMMGVEPIIKTLSMGADVILAGRACDDAIYAAYPIMNGFPTGLALHLGKAIECASLVCIPQKVKQSVWGTITEEAIYLEPVDPEQFATPLSVAAHSMYERINPFIQEVPGGILDMHETVYESYTERICKISGSKFIPSKDNTYKVKLEGAGPVGYRVFQIVGIRDPITIKYLSKIIKDNKAQIHQTFKDKKEGKDYNIFFHIYGINSIMGELEPKSDDLPHEVCIIIEVITEDTDLAASVVQFAKHRFFYAQYPEQVNSSGGGAALIIDEPLHSKNKAYKWTIDHLLRLDDPCDPEVFKIELSEIGK